MFSAMMHAQNKWTGVALREQPVQPTIVQPVPYSTFIGVQNLTDNTRVIYLQQDLNATAPSDITPTGYTWSVVYGNAFATLRVFSGETTNSAVFATSFQYLVELPKDCIVQCTVSTANNVYKIPHVIRWRSQQDPPVIATITNSENSYAINATNIVFTQQPTIQIVGSTITAWSWSVATASWPSYTASSIVASNATTPTPTFVATVPTNELPAYYAIACNISYISPTGYNKTNQVISIVNVY